MILHGLIGFRVIKQFDFSKMTGALSLTNIKYWVSARLGAAMPITHRCDTGDMVAYLHCYITVNVDILIRCIAQE